MEKVNTHILTQCTIKLYDGLIYHFNSSYLILHKNPMVSFKKKSTAGIKYCSVAEKTFNNLTR